MAALGAAAWGARWERRPRRYRRRPDHLGRRQHRHRRDHLHAVRDLHAAWRPLLRRHRQRLPGHEAGLRYLHRRQHLREPPVRRRTVLHTADLRQLLRRDRRRLRAQASPAPRAAAGTECSGGICVASGLRPRASAAPPITSPLLRQIGDGCGGTLDVHDAPRRHLRRAGLPAGRLRRIRLPDVRQCNNAMGEQQYCGTIGNGCGGALECLRRVRERHGVRRGRPAAPARRICPGSTYDGAADVPERDHDHDQRHRLRPGGRQPALQRRSSTSRAVRCRRSRTAPAATAAAPGRRPIAVGADRHAGALHDDARARADDDQHPARHAGRQVAPTDHDPDHPDLHDQRADRQEPDAVAAHPGRRQHPADGDDDGRRRRARVPDPPHRRRRLRVRDRRRGGSRAPLRGRRAARRSFRPAARSRPRRRSGRTRPSSRTTTSRSCRARGAPASTST